jgi:hypothetical protein
MSRYVKFLASSILPRPSFTCGARARISWVAILLSVLSACGGGGGGGSGTLPPVTTAPSDLQYPTAPAFIVDTAITALTPTVVGNVSSYSVSPALPAGLSLSTTTGVISGTPTSTAAKANYTVKATNAGGSTTATVSIEVMAATTAPPSDLKYPNPPEFVVNTAIAPLAPSVVGLVTSYSVTPALPAGLSVNASSGVISGIPTSAAAEAKYTVKASNASGSTTAIVSIVVVAASTGAPSGLNYPTPSVFVVNTAITPLMPTVTGTVTSYSVSPGLPAGLSLDTTSGVISGTPTSVTAKGSYTVKASNFIGSTTATLSIQVTATTAALKITTQPTSVSVPAGATGTFKIVVTGNGTLSYQWYTITFGSSGTVHSTSVAGATASTLTLSASMATAATYDCVVTDTLSNGTTTNATSSYAILTVTPSTVSAAITSDNWVGANTNGLVASVTAQSGATYTWAISNGTITSGQGTTQITYTSGSLGPLQITATVTAQLAGSATAVKNVVVVSTVPMASVFAQSSVLPGATNVSASTPSITGASYAWSLQSGTASATSTGSAASDAFTYGVSASPGSYQVSVNVTDQSGHSGTAQRSVAVVQGTFIKDVRDMAQRSLHTATLLNDGRVLVTGGDTGIPSSVNPTYLPAVSSQSNIVATAEIFDPVTTTWALVGSLATARTQHSATRLNDGRVLVAGGLDASGNALASTEIYDPAQQGWTAGPPLPAALQLPSATLLADGRVLITGGSNGISVVNTAAIYDPATNAWSSAGPMTSPRVLHSLTLLVDGRVLAVGGMTQLGTGAQTESTEIFDPTSDTWQSAAPLVDPLFTAFAEGAVRLPSGDVLVLGSNAQIYDPPTNTWRASIPPCHSCLGGVDATTAILLPNGTVLAAGGFFIQTGGPNIYDPVMQAWTGTSGSPSYDQSKLPVGIFGIFGTVTGLQNGDALFEGGLADETTLVFPPTADNGNSLSIGALYHFGQGSWSILGSQGHGGYYAASGVLANGKVLVTGGSDLRGNDSLLGTKGTADLFDPSTDTWSSAAPMSELRWQHTATVLSSGRMLVTGGTTSSSGPFATAELYDSASNAWSSAGLMSSPRYQHTASLLGNGTVLVAGGNDGDSCTCTTFLTSADLYNPTTNSFTATGPLNTARYAHTATVLANGKVLVTGGFGGATSTIQSGGSALASAEIYDPTAGTWTVTGSMNSPRTNHTATLLPSGKVLVAGGSNGTATEASAEIYDPTSGTWTLAAPMTTPRQSQGSIALPNGTVLIVGGFNDASSAVVGVGTLEVYDPASNTWASSGAMVTPRQFFVLNALGDGRVLLDGGIQPLTGLPEFFR